MNLLVNFLIAALILVVVVYVVKLIIDMLPLPANVKLIALLIVGLIGLLYVLQLLGIPVPGIR